MCRLMAYYGDTVLLARAILWPDRSIIRQSYDARERLLDPSLPAHLGHGNLNADGFGIGWYNEPSVCEALMRGSHDPTPCTFKAITPAWNNDNLARLASKIYSPLMFAHCHPFAYNHYMFMHNGVIAGFSKIRRQLLAGMSDEAYDTVQSFHSDSAVSFALFLNFLPNMTEYVPPEAMLQALQSTINFISRTQSEHGIVSDTSLLNFVITDGRTLIATRFVSPESSNPASLYYAEGSTFRRSDGSDEQGEGEYALEYAERGARVAIIASEPITGASSDWVEVPTNHALIITRDTNGCMNILHTPVHPLVPGPRVDEVISCLGAMQLDARALGAQPDSRADVLKSLAARVNLMQSINGTAATADIDSVAGCGPNCGHMPSNMPSLQQQVLSALRKNGMEHVRLAESPSATASSSQPVPRRGELAARLAGSFSCTQSGTATPPQRGSVRGSTSQLAGAASAPLIESVSADAQAMDLEEHLLTGHRGAILCMVKDGDGLLYTACADKTIKVWDMQALREVATLRGHSRPVLKLQLQDRFLYSIGGSSVRVWDTHTRTCIRRILTSRRAGTLRALCVSRSHTVYVGCQDTTVKGYRLAAQLDALISVPPSVAGEARTAATDVNGRARAQSIDQHSAPCTVIAAAGGSQQAAARATFDLNVESKKVTDADMKVEPDVGHCSAIHSVVCCLGYICSAGGDCMIRVWSCDDMAPVGMLRGHRGPVYTLLAVGGLLLSGGRDGIIRVWDMETLCCRRTLAGHTSDILHLAALAPGLSHNGNSFTEAHGTDDLTGAGDGSRSLDGDDGGAADGAPPPPILASCSADGICYLWDARTWCCIHRFSPPFDQRERHVMCAALVDNLLALGTSEGSLYVYDIEDLMKIVYDGCSAADEGIPASAVPLRGRASNLDYALDSLPPPSPATHTAMQQSLNEHMSDDHPPSYSASVDLSNKAPAQFQSSWTAHTVAVNGVEGSKRKVNAPITWRRPYQLKENAQVRMDAALLRCLKHFVRIRTVSGDPDAHEDCFRGAKYVAALLESLGAEVKLATNARTVHPCVLARLEVCPNKPTVVFYGHYDVQPAQELDWRTDPFKLVSKDGYLYGRGTSDNKGPILAMIFAVKELLDRREGDECAGLPVNLAFVFEGEEEIGSPGLEAAVRENLSWFKNTELIMISNSQWIGDEVPCLTYGMRGMICLTIEVSGAKRDLHSGNEGGVFNEPMSDLCRLLATLVDSHHNILVPGFYDDVDADLLGPTMAGMQASLELHDFDVKEYAAALGVGALTCGNTVEEVLTARWCLPSMSIADIRCSTTNESTARFGPTRFSVVPKTAQGNISIRFVPNQTAEALVNHLQRHLQHEFRKLRSSNRLDIHVVNRGSYWQADPSNQWFTQAARAVKEEWGKAPLAVREGGTMPCASMLETLLGAPGIMLPMGQNSDNCHLSNERLRRVNLIKGKNVVRRILESYAEPVQS